MTFFSKICPLKYRRRAYCTLSIMNLVMLLISTTTPSLLWHRVPEGLFMQGLWSTCDQLGCNEIFITDVYLNIARSFSLLADFTGLIALVSSWELFTRFSNYKIMERQISCMANFSTGILLLCALMIVHLKLRTGVDVEGNRLSLFYGFYIGCTTCFLCFILGTYSLLRHMGWVAEEENVCLEGRPEEKTEPGQAPPK